LHRFVLGAAFCAWAAWPLTAAAALATLTPDEVHPGDRAVVRTVFQGSKIEEFDAEIVGVFRAGRAAGDIIVGRATSERVVKTGIAQGMSGSPVYVNGKLVGALSSGWAFTREPLFGITPIGEMLEVLDHPAAGPSDPTAGPSGVEVAGKRATGAFRELRWSDDEPTPEVASLASERPATAGLAAGLRPLPLPLACGGLQPAAFPAVAAALAPLGFAATPGGNAPDGGPPAADLAPGSAVAVELLRGDLQF
jgi:hypothetical protein